MKIVFNTRYPENVSSESYRQGFLSLKEISFFDWDSYDEYDVALFMAYTNDLLDIEIAKKQNPKLKIGLIDPRNASIQKYIQYIDFIVVDSIEMKDFFGQFQLPIFVYYEYPNLERLKKNHFKKKEIIIGYHGNKVHLGGMYPNISRALELLGEKYKIEFRAMYNIERLGKWKSGVPKNIPIKHIQWSEKNYYEELAQVDIGIVPNLMPIRKINKIKAKAVINKRYFLDSQDDYLTRFKVPSNAGRIIVFSILGIPVVADMFPSALQFIRDEYNGMIAYSCGGWYNALEKLIINPIMRKTLADNMEKSINQIVDFKIQNEKFIKFLEKILHTQKGMILPPITQPEDDLSTNFSFWCENFRLLTSRIISKLRRIFNNR